MQQSPIPTREWAGFYFIVERQHGSSKKAWSQSRGQEGRRHTRPEQGGSQRIRAQRRTHACKKKGGSRRIGAQGCTQAPVAGIESKQEKAGDHRRLFFFIVSSAR
jgi:hypothetical protein